MNLKITESCIAFENYWQKPAITELHSYEVIKNQKLGDFLYLAFPWATLIDFLQTRKKIPNDLKNAYLSIIKYANNDKRKKITVCQHIFYYKYSNLFKSCQVSELFSPHANFRVQQIDEMGIHPYPLFPVITPHDNEIIFDIADRDLDFSFVGAYDKKYYQTNIREKIFKIDKWATSKFFIKERTEWHYQNEVYKNQLDHKEFSSVNIDDEAIKKEIEYRNILNRSIFSLCPSGSGPNSIRLFESMAYQSIPVIFANNLRLPGELTKWNDAVLFFDENQSGVDKFLASLPDYLANRALLQVKRKASLEIFHSLSGENFVLPIIELVNGSRIQSRIDEIPGKEKISNKIYIIDSGLKDKGSHHHIINSQLSKLNPNIVVLSNKKAKQSDFTYKVEPIFKYSIYDYNSSEISKLHSQAVSTAVELIAVLQDVDKPLSLYIHSCTQPLIQALVLSLDKLKMVKSILIELMFLPSGIILNSDNNSYEDFNSHKITKALVDLNEICNKNNIKLTVNTSNRIYQEFFNAQISETTTQKFSVGLHPHVIYNNPPNTFVKKVNDPIRILCHAGDPRSGKGIEWLYKNLPKLIDRTSDLEFYIHANTLRFPEAFPKIAKSLKGIEELSVLHSRIKLDRSYIEADRWDEFLASFDKYLLPLEPVSYKDKTSGIIIDLLKHIQNIKNLFIYENTFSYQLLKESGLETNVITDNVNDLSNKLQITFDNKNVKHTNLRESQIYRDFYSKPHPKYVIEALLEVI